MNEKLRTFCQFLGYLLISASLVLAGFKAGTTITASNNCKSLGGIYIKHPETGKLSCVSLDILEKCSYVRSSEIYCGGDSNENRTRNKQYDWE